VTTDDTLTPKGVYVISSNGLVPKTNNYSLTNDIDRLLSITDIEIISHYKITSTVVYKNMTLSTFTKNFQLPI